MATSRRSERIRFRYGICYSENCPKCRSKEVQAIPARKELVCPECGKPLHECPPPKKSSNKPLIIGIVAAAVVIACGVGAYFLFFRSVPEEEVAVEEAVEQVEETQPEALPADTLQTDTVAENATPPENEAASAPAPNDQQHAPVQRSSDNSSNVPQRNSGATAQSGSVNLGYGTYQGEMSGGKPHGQGKLVYSRQTVISRYDPKARTAEAGEYVQGLFSNGYPTIVKHYDANGHLIETLNLGVD